MRQAWAMGVVLAALWAGAARAQITPLWELDAPALAARQAGDVAAVVVYRRGLESALRHVRARPDLFPLKKISADETWVLLNEERSDALLIWRTLLDYTLALDSVGRYHRDFYRLKAPARETSLLITQAAFLAQYRFALEFLDIADNYRGYHTIFNEPITQLGLPGETYAHYKFRFLNVGRATEFAALAAAARIAGSERAPELRAGIAEDSDVILKAGRGRGPMLTLQNGVQILRDGAAQAWFPVQAGIAEWMGDTRVRRQGGALVSAEQIAAMSGKLQPGDILLSRREWYLSNVGLPGFWSHAALYVGAPEERRALFNTPEVKAWVMKQGRADGDFEALLKSRHAHAYEQSATAQEGTLPRVIEAVSEGVIFTTLEHSAAADHLAVLRPRLSAVARASALLRAFKFAGLPYDFDFDFQTDSALVCTELVYKAYAPAPDMPGLTLPTVNILGRQACPANMVAFVFDVQCGAKEQQMDLVLFLDGDESTGQAAVAGLEAFRASWQRPKWHIMTK